MLTKEAAENKERDGKEDRPASPLKPSCFSSKKRPPDPSSRPALRSKEEGSSASTTLSSSGASILSALSPTSSSSSVAAHNKGIRGDVGDAIAQTLPYFCFPEEKLSIHGWEQRRSTGRDPTGETLSLVLTDEVGNKLYAYCRRFRCAVLPQRLCCIALVVSVPAFNFFSKVLKEFAYKISNPPVEVDQADMEELGIVESSVTSVDSNNSNNLNRNCHRDISRSSTAGPLLQKGAIFGLLDQLSYHTSQREGSRDLGRYSGNSFLLDHVSFRSLFSRSSVENVVDILQLILAEKRVVLAANTITGLTEAVNAVLALVISLRLVLHPHSSASTQHAELLVRSCPGACGHPLVFSRFFGWNEG